jgi:hypothetical protein
MKFPVFFPVCREFQPGEGLASEGNPGHVAGTRSNSEMLLTYGARPLLARLSKSRVVLLTHPELQANP